MSELVQVKIKASVITSRYGSLQAGDLLRTDAEFAKHLVEDCSAAEYVALVVDSPVVQDKPTPPSGSMRSEGDVPVAVTPAESIGSKVKNAIKNATKAVLGSE